MKPTNTNRSKNAENPLNGFHFELKPLDLEAGTPEVVLNPKDAVERGLRPLDRVRVIPKGSLTGSVAVIKLARNVEIGKVGASKELMERLEVKGGVIVELIPGTRPKSVEYIRRKLDGHPLNVEQMNEVIGDIASGNLTDIELTAWATATYVHDMTIDEIVACVEAMVRTGETVTFERGPVMDVHSIGGVPGNKYAPLAVSIAAANGLLIPKTSSRAISSACGTADFMEVISPVEFSAQDIKRIAEEAGGTLCWGGGVNLAPADDEIIRVEYPLSIDPRGQLLASVLAKKKAVGAQNVVIDIPIGDGAKVADSEKARSLARDFIVVGERLGMRVQCAISFGAQPIGRAIGPVLEIREALQVLEGSDKPASLIEKACSLSGILLEMGGAAPRGQGYNLAVETLRSGKAHKQFQMILKAQGADPNVKSTDLKPGPLEATILSPQHGYVETLDNKKLVRIARAAGSPRDKGAGIYLHEKKGRRVDEGAPIYTIYAEHEHKLKEAVSLANHLKPIQIEGMVIEEIVE
jgi:AMP phosphorylase